MQHGQCGFAVAQPCITRCHPRGAPTGVSAAMGQTDCEALAGCCGQVGSTPRRNLGRRVEPIEVRNMPVPRFGFGRLMSPLLQTTVSTDDGCRQARQGRAYLGEPWFVECQPLCHVETGQPECPGHGNVRLTADRHAARLPIGGHEWILGRGRRAALERAIGLRL